MAHRSQSSCPPSSLPSLVVRRSPLQQLAERVLSEGADYVAVYVVGEGGLRAAVAVARDPGRQGFIDGARRRPPKANHPVARACAECRPLVVQISDLALAASISHDSDHYQRLKELHAKSVVVAPMLRNGEVIGALAMLSMVEGKYSDADIPRAEAYSAAAVEALKPASQPASQPASARAVPGSVTR